MMRRMSAREFDEWWLLYQMDPWGEIRADYRNALACALLAAIHRGKKGKRYKLEDFLLKFGEDPGKQRQSWQEMLAVAKTVTEQYRVHHERQTSWKEARTG